jgi:hypothetical protein
LVLIFGMMGNSLSWVATIVVKVENEDGVSAAVGVSRHG